MEQLKQIINESLKNIDKVEPDKQGLIKEAAYYALTLNSKIKKWKENGSKTFILSKNLIEAFVNTDISFELRPCDFQYPFESFLIEGEAPLFQTKIFNTSRPVTEILYLNSALFNNDKNIIALDCEGNSNVQCNWDHSLDAFCPSLEGIAFERLMLYMKKDASIQESVDTSKPGKTILNLDPEDAKNMVNMFFNTILYINDPTRIPSETEIRGSRKLKISGKEYKRNEYIYLKPPKSYKPLYKSSGKTLHVRFIVRGHWRNQACGEKLASHKLIWIKPFWKGPDMSEIVSKPYVIKN